VLADFAAYAECQQRVSEAWKDQERWTRLSIVNTARAGKFSSDRAVRECCEEIWQVPAAEVRLG
jgi:starch phosphorylase